MTTWNPSDAGAGVALSDSDRTAVVSGASVYAVRSTTHFAAGKYYAEVVFVANGPKRIGFADNTASLSNTIGASGVSTGLASGGSISVSGMTLVNSFTLAGFNLGDVFNLAVDFGAGNIWFGKNGVWSGSGNPATGANPNVTFTPATALFLAASGVSGAGMLLCTNNAQFSYVPPSGFAPWDAPSFVVAGAGVGTSPDGSTWSYQASPLADAVAGIAYGAGVFVAVGGDPDSGGMIATSPDLVNWTTRSGAWSPEGINDVIFAGGQFVAVASGGYLATSPDGVTWTLRISNAGGSGLLSFYDIDAVTWGNGLYVIGANNGLVATSPDGVAWTLRTSGFTGLATSDHVYAAVYGSGLFVIGGDNGQLATSPDGVTWTLRTSGFGSSPIKGLAYSAVAGLFVAVGAGGNIFTSSDGVTWTSRTSGTSNLLNAVGYQYGLGFAYGLLVIAGINGTLLTSSDGVTWTSRTSGFGGSYILAAPNLFTVVTVDFAGGPQILSSARTGASALPESIGNLRRDLVTLLEGSPTLRRDFAGVLELLRTVSADRGKPLQAILNIRTDGPALAESIGNLRRDLVTLLEGSPTLRRDFAGVLELLRTVSADRAAVAEALRLVYGDRFDRVEAIVGLITSGDGVVVLENIGSFTRGSPAPAMSLLGVNAGAAQPVAAALTARSDAGGRAEFTLTIYGDRFDRLDALLGVIAAFDAPVPIETIGAARREVGDPLEAQHGVARCEVPAIAITLNLHRDHAQPGEMGGGVQAAAAAPAEAIANLLRGGAAAIEAVAGAQVFSVGADEFTRLVRGERFDRLESIVGLVAFSEGVLPLETIGVLRSDDAQLPIESVLSVISDDAGEQFTIIVYGRLAYRIRAHGGALPIIGRTSIDGTNENMTTHDPLNRVCSRSWSFDGTLLDYYGKPVPLTGASITWRLDSLDGTINFITKTLGNGIEIVNYDSAEISVTPTQEDTDPVKVPPADPTATPPVLGVYRNWLTVTLADGSTFDMWSGIIRVTAAPA
jgi:hypothetical protein